MAPLLRRCYVQTVGSPAKEVNTIGIGYLRFGLASVV
jgi:hypothetical protein